MIKRSGRCLCGKVTYEVRGAPLRVGLCHCTDCRREGGAIFAAFAIWPRHAFSATGQTASFEGRNFCPNCGSRLFGFSGEEAEIRLGSLDMAPTDLEPTYELWVKRRESWLHAQPGTDQHDEDRPD